MEKAPASKKKKEIAVEFDIHQSTLSTILKNKVSLKASSTSGSKNRKHNRDPTRTDVDTTLRLWFSAARAQSGQKLKSLLPNYTLQHWGHVPMVGYHDGGRGAILNTEWYLERMLPLILLFATIGENRLSNLSSSVTLPITCSMPMRWSSTGGYCLTKPILLKVKPARWEKE